MAEEFEVKRWMIDEDKVFVTLGVTISLGNCEFTKIGAGLFTTITSDETPEKAFDRAEGVTITYLEHRAIPLKNKILNIIHPKE